MSQTRDIHREGHAVTAEPGKEWINRSELSVRQKPEAETIWRTELGLDCTMLYGEALSVG